MNTLQGNARYIALLHDAGLKSTAPRIRVLKFFSAAKTPLRIKDIFEKLKAKDPGIDMVTLYRTIGILSKHNIVHRVDFSENSAYYELADGARHRHHITCTGCHKRADVDLCPFSEYEDRLHKKIPLGWCRCCEADNNTPKGSRLLHILYHNPIDELSETTLPLRDIRCQAPPKLPY